MWHFLFLLKFLWDPCQNQFESFWYLLIVLIGFSGSWRVHFKIPFVLRPYWLNVSSFFCYCKGRVLKVFFNFFTGIKQFDQFTKNRFERSLQKFTKNPLGLLIWTTFDFWVHWVSSKDIFVQDNKFCLYLFPKHFFWKSTEAVPACQILFFRKSIYYTLVMQILTMVRYIFGWNIVKTCIRCQKSKTRRHIKIRNHSNYSKTIPFLLKQ